ncbi:hypothetical protein F751_3514 [Auxenochlorella protothecoides]|uniref:Uncharacterized protein n=1 Tax=Auxenochlorella protothecoides TaxID=3075 RepID=A0A087SSI0_AUXPR|nr:hypothetical protein F751_3514 [Auxenochlorella protothecoides]KFM28684.1 hypothetical protein F751_3514 [Auxenochlorella protothecoides]
MGQGGEKAYYALQLLVGPVEKHPDLSLSDVPCTFITCILQGVGPIEASSPDCGALLPFVGRHDRKQSASRSERSAARHLRKQCFITALFRQRVRRWGPPTRGERSF